MEFPNAMVTKLTVLPRAYRGTGIGQHGSGMKWTSAYGVVGMDAFGQPGAMTDAMNDTGLVRRTPVHAGLPHDAKASRARLLLPSRFVSG